MNPIVDTAEMTRIRSDGAGYIYNDFSGAGPSGDSYNVLHKATCRRLENATVPPRKYFAHNVDTAVDWLNANREPEGQNWKRCDFPNSNCFG